MKDTPASEYRQELLQWHGKQMKRRRQKNPDLFRRVEEALFKQNIFDTRILSQLCDEVDGIVQPDWPKQSEVAKRLGINKMAVHRLICAKKLLTNGAEGQQCRVDPASILAYCKREGITYNET